MTPTVFALVLLAALGHALWNTWLKTSGDRIVALALLGAGWGVAGLASLPVVGMPEPRVWPYLLASTAVHTAYALALIRAYARGKLTVAYPIARGLGPLIVTLFSTTVLGDTLGLAGIAGVSMLIAGIFWLGIPDRAPDRSVVLLSLLTGILIGCYTLLDGTGGRAGESAHTYAAWLFLLTSAPVILLALVIHGRRLPTLAAPVWKKGLTAGVLSAAAYWIVVWAMSEAHMGLVAALRESSVLFAGLIGYFVLRERVRWAAVGLVFGGIALTRLA